MSMTHGGSRFCGAVTIEAAGEPIEMSYCHCGDCRSYSGAPLAVFALFKAEHVRVIEGEALLGGINRIGMSPRRFCTQCGGHLMTGHPGLGFTDVHAEKLPSLAFRPSVHLNYAEAVLRIKDGVPKLKDFPAHAGGSGTEVAEQGGSARARRLERTKRHSEPFSPAGHGAALALCGLRPDPLLQMSALP